MLNRPSRTAQGTAVQRAAHQLFDRPLVFEDPLALKVLGPGTAAALSQQGARLSTTQSANIRAFVVVRSRFAEERLMAAAKRGVRQYVLLGAGLDTFAYRNNDPDLRVFELDHPATQAMKKELLARAGIAVPPTLMFAPLDLEHDNVVVTLKRAGFDFGRPGQVSFLGVALYLEREAVVTLLGSLARALAKGSEIVFDFASPEHELDPVQRKVFDAMARESEQLGEPFRSSFVPAELAARLAALGPWEVETLGSQELNRRYLEGRQDGVALAGLGRIGRLAI